MFKRFNRTERALLLTAIAVGLLVVLVIFAAVAVQYYRSIQPTPTQSSLPAVWTATPAAAAATLRPSSTPFPTNTPVILPTRTPTP
jgi:hypothetical protein